MSSSTQKEPEQKSSLSMTVPVDPTFVYPVTSFPSINAFEIKIEHPALIIPARRTAELRNMLRGVIMHRPKTKSVHTVSEDKNSRKMLLHIDENIWKNASIVSLLHEEGVRKSSHTIQFDYNDLTVEEVLRKLLPVREVPSAFEIAGHIAHVNLRPELLPFKYIVGKVILDKNAPRIQTVVNKVGSIATEYRTFGMEILAGSSAKDWSVVTVKEEGCRFQLDFQNVYWNSRLGGEHRRLVKHIQKDASGKHIIVADLMAGVGPFAVPLTAVSRQQQEQNSPLLTVHANDLNPTSYKYLQINSTQNKCQNLHSYNLDARAFVHDLDARGIEYDHVIMNLPATAPEFLDAFRGFPSDKPLPRIHVHCFSGKPQKEPKEDDDKDEVLERCSEALGCELHPTQHAVTVHLVRDVAPKKNMLCVSFTLPKQVRNVPRLQLAVAQNDRHVSNEEPPNKKSKAC